MVMTEPSKIWRCHLKLHTHISSAVSASDAKEAALLFAFDRMRHTMLPQEVVVLLPGGGEKIFVVTTLIGEKIPT
jgi:predicted ATP-grasp superfamily ATP-dependent carboligase